MGEGDKGKSQLDELLKRAKEGKVPHVGPPIPPGFVGPFGGNANPQTLHPGFGQPFGAKKP